jgi:hypothetical protein
MRLHPDVGWTYGNPRLLLKFPGGCVSWCPVPVSVLKTLTIHHRRIFGAAWHRKDFIEFEGVRQIAGAYRKGRHPGQDETGFIPFGSDLTPHLNPGGKNILAVRSKNSGLPLHKLRLKTDEVLRIPGNSEQGIAVKSGLNLKIFRRSVTNDASESK